MSRSALHAGIHAAGLTALATLAALALMLISPAPARAESLEQIRALAEQLGSEDADQRRAAYQALTTLEESSVPAISARLEEIRRGRPDEETARRIVFSFRHAVGSRRADDDVDIAPGVLTVLDSFRDRGHLRMAETLLLWRSLERINTFESTCAMHAILPLDGAAWRWEQRRLLSRMGPDLAAAAIAGRSHSDVHVRRWARRTEQELGTDNPGRLVQELNPKQLADVIRALGQARRMNAMRVISSYIDSERRGVRLAAREAMQGYGRNAIWVLREAYHTRLGERADRAWGIEHTRDELYSRLDARRMAPVQEALAQAEAARERGDLVAMREGYEAVLLRAPELGQPQTVARGYAELGEARLEGDDLAGALSAYRRAVRLAPSATEADRWRAQIAYIEAERSLARGVIDLHAYRAALALDPDHAEVQAILAGFEREEGDPVRSRRIVLWMAVLLFLLVGGAFLYRGTEEEELGEVLEEEPLPDANSGAVYSEVAYSETLKAEEGGGWDPDQGFHGELALDPADRTTS